MIGKLLFTLGVIVVVAFVWRTRRPAAPENRVPRLVNPAPPTRRWPIRGLALAGGGVMLLASVYLLYDHWRDNNEVIFIRVVDASSGRSAEYRAQRGDIEDREFVTTDGRRIVLAETERLETSTVRSPGVLDRN
jgi:hypothetical protein